MGTKKKASRRAFAKFGTKNLVLASFAISSVECALILLHIIPPILSYSPANMAAAVAYFAVLALGGYESKHAGLLRAAAAGALIAIGRVSVIVAAAIIGSQMQTIVIGMQIPDQVPLFALYLVILAENVAVGAAVSLLFALIGAFLKKKLG